MVITHISDLFGIESSKAKNLANRWLESLNGVEDYETSYLYINPNTSTFKGVPNGS